MRWGFLGAGFIASRALGPAVHAAEGAVLQAVAARDERRARALEPAGRTYTEYAALCADSEVDAVYIALPGSDHLPWTLTALGEGKHVLCEKPLAGNADELGLMVAAAADADRVLVEAAWNRWHPRTRRLLRLVADDDPGGPLEVSATFTFGGVPSGNYRLDPKRGGGALYDVGCYCIAAAQALLGSAASPLDVESAAAVVGPTGVDLTTTAVLSSSRGRARITASIDAPEAQQLLVAGAGWSAELVGSAFTSWNEASTLRVHHGGRAYDEEFAPVDAYRSMVEAVGRRASGDPTAWVLPLGESAAAATTLDRIRSNTEGTSA